MEKRRYNKEALDVSLLGLGCMRLPKIDPNRDDIDEKEAQKIVDYAYAHGVNYYDTAYMYHGGKSEAFIGKALKKYPRDSYFLASKMPIWEVHQQSDLERIFQTQLQRCGVDYFDFYLFHSVNKTNFQDHLKYNTFDFLTKMKQEGRIHHIGFSFHDTPEVMESDVIDRYPWEFVQIQLNYLDWEMQNAKKQYELARSRGLQCIIMEPVRGGTLANPCEAANALFLQARPDKSIASWAIRFAASLPNVLTVLSGMSTIEQIADNVKTLTDFEPLTEQDYQVIAEAVDAYKKKDTVPCTGCRYCMDCAFGVDIPAVFSVYNQYAIDRDKAAFIKAYDQLGKDAQASSCTACESCMQHCPQHIVIPEKMRMIDGLAENLRAEK